MPDADRVRDALSRCPFVVVSDVVRHTDTTALAHVLLPSSAWGEKDGTVTNSERRISRQRRFLPRPGDARPDWWQLCEVGKRMGFAELAYHGPWAIFAEYAALTGFENSGSRDLDISAYSNITNGEYAALPPFQWPAPAGAAASRDTRFFAEGAYFTPNHKARFVATSFRAPMAPTSPEFPLVLNTGRTRDQWHTMTRTGKTSRLTAHSPEPFVDIHPDDASIYNLVDGAIAELKSRAGSALFRVRHSADQQRGSVFAPIHWTGQFASRSRTDALANAFTDPISGQPELKHTPVSIKPFEAVWHGALLSLGRPRQDTTDYVAFVPAARGYQAELAGAATPFDWDEFGRSLISANEAAVEVLAYHDTAAGQHRYAAFMGETLVGLLFISSQPLAITRAWAAEQLGAEIAPAVRLRLLAGRPGAGVKDKGPTVCACFEIGRNQIVDAIVGGCATVASVGTTLKAGTNCGSCRTEIGRLINEARLQKAG